MAATPNPPVSVINSRSLDISWRDITPHRIYSRFPWVWIGFVFVALSLLCNVLQLTAKTEEDASAFQGLAMLVRWIGSIYWMLCVYRWHRILAQFSDRKYPISPIKSVALHIIPLFVYYWFFRWTRALADFVNQRAQARMSASIPGWTLLIASLCGFAALPGLSELPEISLLGSVKLFLLFALGLSINGKLRASLPKPQPFQARRLLQLKIATSAGVGAAFSFVLVQAIHHFQLQQRSEKIHELIAILAVSAGFLIFFEPLFETLRIALGEGSHHEHPAKRRPWLLRLALFVILVLASIFHGLVHGEIENGMIHQPGQTLSMLVAALLVSGGITYFWIGASFELPSHAARSGAFSGMILGSLLMFSVWTAVSSNHRATEGPTAVEAGVAFACPLIPQHAWNDLKNGSFQAVNLLDTVGPWVLFGFIGGLVIDRSNTRRMIKVTIAISIAAVVYGIVMGVFLHVSLAEILSHISAVVGWGLALVVCSSSDERLLPLTNELLETHPRAEGAVA